MDGVRSDICFLAPALSGLDLILGGGRGKGGVPDGEVAPYVCVVLMLKVLS